MFLQRCSVDKHTHTHTNYFIYAEKLLVSVAVKPHLPGQIGEVFGCEDWITMIGGLLEVRRHDDKGSSVNALLLTALGEAKACLRSRRPTVAPLCLCRSSVPEPWPQLHMLIISHRRFLLSQHSQLNCHVPVFPSPHLLTISPYKWRYLLGSALHPLLLYAFDIRTW